MKNNKLIITLLIILSIIVLILVYMNHKKTEQINQLKANISKIENEEKMIEIYKNDIQTIKELKQEILGQEQKQEEMKKQIIEFTNLIEENKEKIEEFNK